MRKGHIFLVCIIIIMLIISISVIIKENDNDSNIPLAKQDDILITLKINELKNQSWISIISSMENTRNHTIHLEGGFLSIITVENIENSSDGFNKTIWRENPDGKDWTPNHGEAIYLTIVLSENKSTPIRTYEVQTQFAFKKSSDSSNDGINVFSNIMKFNTTKEIDHFRTVTAKWDD